MSLQGNVCHQYVLNAYYTVNEVSIKYYDIYSITCLYVVSLLVYLQHKTGDQKSEDSVVSTSLVTILDDEAELVSVGHHQSHVHHPLDHCLLGGVRVLERKRRTRLAGLRDLQFCVVVVHDGALVNTEH